MEPQLAAPRLPILPASFVLMMLMSGVLGAVWARTAYAVLAPRDEAPVALIRRPHAPPRPHARPLPPPPPPSASAAGRCQPSPVIRWTGTRYEISRKVFDNPPTEGIGCHTPRIVPSIGNGKHSGFKIYGIRPCSVPEQLGLQNGDLVASINGVEPLTPDSLLTSFRTLRTATDFTVRIERRGQLVTQHYHLYDAPKPRRAGSLHRGAIPR